MIALAIVSIFNAEINHFYLNIWLKFMVQLVSVRDASLLVPRRATSRTASLVIASIPCSLLSPVLRARGAKIYECYKVESTPKTHKTKNVSFGDIFHFLN